MTNAKMRIIEGVVTPAEQVSFTFEGMPYVGYPGETIASALMRSGFLPIRRTRIAGEPRGYYCGMGICWDCAVFVEGEGVVRSCGYPVAEGVVISYADGEGTSHG